MRTLDNYLDRARQAAGLTSDRQLAIRLGKDAGTVWQFRHGRAWPSDETMLTLAAIAGVAQAEALLELNRWRTEGTAAAAVYRDLARKIAGAGAVVLAFGLGLVGFADTAHAFAGAAGNISTTVTHHALEIIYIMRSWARRPTRLLRLPAMV